ncbi:MAG: hydantoinase/oxoprolinase family protein [Methanobacteriaceae archaeon]|nr:hydantoinase/oxoprolinase family protein [Methanobacteriaceae archaeon]
MIIAGLDIGGANTDVSIIEYDAENNIIARISDFKYIPMWQKNDTLINELHELTDKYDIDFVGVSMTAELVDSYKTKKEGVLDIANKVMNTFDVPVYFLSKNGIIDYDLLKKDPLNVAAFNWIGTCYLVGKLCSECIFIDMGSTTTDIIPVINGINHSQGKSDLERLNTGELVYTGILRSNVISIVNKVPINNSMYHVASELFATTSDVHMILNNINKSDYINDTVDGSGKEIIDCMRRLSRIVCADLNLLSKEDIINICKYIHEKQILMVKKSLEEVVNRTGINTVVLTGLGKDIVCYEAAKLLNLNIINMGDTFSNDECTIAPAIGLAYMLHDYLN